MELKTLFATPIVKLRVPETEALKRQYLPEMLRRYEARAYPRPEMWETDRIHTSFGAPWKEQVMTALPPAYEKLLRQFVRAELSVGIALWHSVYWKGGEFQERHHHIPCHFSFIHFLQFDPSEHRPPVFYDPARTVKAYCQNDEIPPAYWSESGTIDVAEGDALVFPSYVEHSVPAGTYRTPRVTVSMNVTLPRKAA